MVPTETLLDVIDRLHSLPGRPCGSAIVNCIRVLSERNLPSQALEIVLFYAMHDPDPEADIWQEDAGGNRH